MFYCNGCGKMEDEDFVGYGVNENGEEFCEETLPQDEDAAVEEARVTLIELIHDYTKE
jgi:hypothetical protein